jgi:hypothetical protein
MSLSGENFCGGELWNVNLTWFTDSPDFTPCFHKTVLVYLPCAFLWILSPIEIRSNLISKKRFIAWTWVNISKLVSTGLLCVLAILELVRFSLLKNNVEFQAEVVGADFASSTIRLATYLLEILFVLVAKRSGKTYFVLNQFFLFGEFVLGFIQPLNICFLLLHFLSTIW